LIALASVAGLLLASPALAIPIAPEQAHSPNAEDITTGYWVMLIVGGAIGLAINVALVMAILRFRARRGAEPRRVQSGRGLQGRVTGALSLLALVLFVFGIILTERARDVEPSGPDGLEASLALSAQTNISAPVDVAPLEINVSGQRWLWRFEYPTDSASRTFSYQELVVPVDTAVVLRITSVDVMHRWWVPALGGQVDAIPGQHQETWFKADEVGVYEGQSTAFSGPSYPTMTATVRVVSAEEYQAWLEQQAADLAEAQRAVAETVVPEEAAVDDEGPAAEAGGPAEEGAEAGGPGAEGGGPGGPSAEAGGEEAPVQGEPLQITSPESGDLVFEPTELEAPAGEVTIEYTNPSAVPHNVAIEGPGGDALSEGEIVADGALSTASGELDPGDYVFYCSVPGHREAGMEGSLTVGAAGAAQGSEGGK
jgi:cytochrome c oxidase subunit 2